MALTLSLIHWTPLTICLAIFAAVALLNTITALIVFGGRLCPSAEPVTEPPTESEILQQFYERAWLVAVSDPETQIRALALGVDGWKAMLRCGCRCHSEAMFPGMRCLDCYGLDCDEGTQQ